MRLWRQVSKRELCNHCGGNSWCAVSTDGHVTKCMRNLLGEGAVRGTDAKGDYALYFDDSDGRTKYVKPVYEGPPLASVETRDNVYRAVLDLMKLAPEWRADLVRRGLSDAEIDAEGFRSMPKGSGASLPHALVHDFSPATLVGVPGFYMGKQRLCAEVVEGMWIPVRDDQGRIIAIKVRRTREYEEKTGKKYSYFTSTSHDGPGPNAPAHAPSIGKPGARIRVTEGELKAAVCCAKTDVFTISIPGATQLLSSGAIDLLKAFGAKEALLAWDCDVTRDYGLMADGRQKRNYVASGLEHAMHLLTAEGFVCAIEQWPAEAGKGIDDVIAAGNADQIVTYEGQDAWDRVLDNLVAGKSEPRSDTLSRVSEACRARWEATQPVPEREQLEPMESWLQPQEGAPEGASEGSDVVGGVAASEPEQTQSASEEAWVPGGTTHDAAGLSGLDAALAQAGEAPAPRRSGPKVGGGGKPPGRPKKPKYDGPPGDFSRGDEVELAETLLIDLQDSSPENVICDRGLLWRYESVLGLWQQIPWDTAYHVVAKYAGRSHPNAKGEPVPLKLSANNIKGTLKNAENFGKRNARAYETSGLFFDRAPRGIATQDKFVRITDDGEVILEPLSAEHRQTVCLPFHWNPDAPAPKWQAFYDAVFANCEQDEAQRRQDALDEMAGACLFGVATRYQKCFLLSGSGSNGKGTWSKVISSLFPREFVCSMTPKDLSTQFALDAIAGKRLNLVGEIPNKTLESTDKLKALIAADEMMAEPKGKPHYAFIPEAGHIWGVNELPPTLDHTHGFYRRFVVVPFQMTFHEGSDAKVDYHKELITELPGIFARCVFALQRLVHRGNFQSPQGSVEAINEWKDLSDQVRVFVRDCCCVDPNAKTSLSGMYASYEYWARQNGHKPMASNTLGARLKQLHHAKHTATSRFYMLTILERGAAGSTRQSVPSATAH